MAFVSLAQRRTERDPRTDGDLVRAVRAGDHRAQEALFFRMGPMLMRTAHRLLGGHEVDDVVQDTFVAALERLPQLKDPERIQPWMRSILINQVRRRIRKRTLKRRLGLGPAPDPIDAERMVSPEASPEVTTELQQLYRILEKLPGEERIALVLRRVEEQTVPQIAEIMGVSLSTAKRRIQASETKLLKALAQGGPS